MSSKRSTQLHEIGVFYEKVYRKDDPGLKWRYLPGAEANLLVPSMGSQYPSVEKQSTSALNR